jgi:hypothetical protein
LEEHIASIFRVEIVSAKPEDDTLHNHRCENLKSYISHLLLCTHEAKLEKCLLALPFLSFPAQEVMNEFS